MSCAASLTWAASGQIEFTSQSQPVHSVCPIYREIFGRSLILSPQAQGREIRLGPLAASLEEMRQILPALLSAAGYRVRSVAPTVDMLEDIGGSPVFDDEQTSERLALRFANASEIVTASAGLWSSAPAAVVPASSALTPAPAAFVRPPAATAPPAAPAPPPVLHAAPDNALHFSGTRSQLERLRSFVQTMDVPSRSVSLRAIIGHVSLGGQYETGLDWLNALDDVTVGNAGPGQVFVPSRAAAPALSFYGSVGPLSRYLKLSEESADFRTDSRPSLVVRSGSSAEISSGQRLAYPQSVLTTGNGQASTSATVAYQEVALRLKVEAFVNSSNQITLKIIQANDSVSGTSTISGNQVPNIGSQSLTTEVVMQSGETVALGGIITNRQQGKRRGVSRLRSIPLVGRLFEVRSASSTQEELVILIEASLVPSR